MRSNLKFSQIPDVLPYPSSIRGRLSTAHSNAVMQASLSFSGSLKERRKIISSLNIISYMYLSGDSFPTTWSDKNPLDNLPDVDDDIVKKTIGDLYLVESNINFDLSRSEVNISPTPSRSESSTNVHKSATPKSDLFIQPPVVPKFDVNKPVISDSKNGSQYVVYTSVPEIPRKQNEISCTTNLAAMKDSDLLALFPNVLIHTRAESMYVPCGALKMHPVLGTLIPIGNYTEDQLIDNIIKYPHFYKLMKITDSGPVNFYSTIEIDEELIPVSEAWKQLDDTRSIPYSSDFVKEYVVRRYLLERDIDHIDHKFKMYGSLDPFLTLFASIDVYASLGYSDPIYLAKKCVASRVSYKQSRNPVLRRLQDV